MRRLKHRVGLALPLGLAIVAGVGANAHALSLTRFLMSAAEAPAVVQRREEAGGSETAGLRLLDRVEFRTETDEFRLSRQQYALRFVPNDRDVLAAEEELHEALLASARAEAGLALHQALKTRYALAIDLLYRRELLDLNRRMADIAEDRLRVLRKTVNAPDFQPEDIVRAEEGLTDLNLERLSLEGALEEIRERVGRCVPGADGTPEWTADGLVETGDIEAEIGRERDATANVYLEERRRRTAVARKRHELEKSGDGLRISYVEAGWNEAESGAFEKAFSLELGVEFPVDASRPELERKRREAASESLREREMEAELAEKRIGLVHELKRRIAGYRLLAARERESGKPALLRNWAGVEGISPLPLLNVKESILKDERARVEHRYAIYADYLEWLDVSGLLSERPLRNRLSRFREPME